MNCEKRQKLLHLYREGELSGRQAKSLDRHLERCPECRTVQERLGRLEMTVRKLRENVPVSANPEMLTGRIMNAVAGLQGDPRSAGFSASLSSAAQDDRLSPDRRRDSFRHPAPGWLFGTGRIRFSLAAAVALVVVAFFIQESMILSRISRLEGRMAVISTNQAAQVSLREAFPNVDGIDGIQKSILTRSAGREEWVRIRKADLDRLIRIVRKQVPGINTLDEAMSVDQKTMLQILRRNSGIVHQLLQSS
jgi:hypothetical protein